MTKRSLRFPKILAIVAALMLTAMSSAAQDDSGKARPCSGMEHRQFDFWLGEWEVTAKGKIAGTNRVTSILGGCVIMEEWESSGGAYKGKSFNRFDPVTQKWEQFWVDSSGGYLRLAGHYNDGRMTLQGKHTVAGESVLDRITWTKNEDGTVRQLWEKSKDDGETWTTAFDGLYRKS